MKNLKDYFDRQKNKKKTFNIFRVLHEETDERRLHSRFISYLLSPEQISLKQVFLKSLLEIAGITGFDEDCTVKVRPNFSDKSEYENIDILIYNDKQAIIIENKIHADDSNLQDMPTGYNGQLERYYNTITSGRNKHKKTIELGKREVVAVIYLTLDGHLPSSESRGNIPDGVITYMDYPNDISRWLEECIAKAPEEEIELLESIRQYQTLVKELTSDLNQAMKNQEILSKDIEKAWELQTEENYFTAECFEIFKHIKWHTVAFFFDELSSALTEAKIHPRPEPEDITKVTHKQEGKAISKLILKFKYKEAELQIVNDKKGFTLGNLTSNRWGEFSQKVKRDSNEINIRDIKFCDFSNEATFLMINKPFRKNVIDEIVKETKKEYQNLKNTF